ncbi:hypothetical protein NPIL_401401 [Nephila pilipes]|uniref:Uncharacterized protein n=1 Tax=Nephila pilipes TaxID=299642 RepID=A0A8X6NNP5_NEPPI|nr:hypothetical protein NPIL_401401 [Nephila pilipes]
MLAILGKYELLICSSIDVHVEQVNQKMSPYEPVSKRFSFYICHFRSRERRPPQLHHTKELRDPISFSMPLSHLNIWKSLLELNIEPDKIQHVNCYNDLRL